MTAATAGNYDNSALLTAVLHYALLDTEPKARGAYEACRSVIAEHGPPRMHPRRRRKLELSRML